MLLKLKEDEVTHLSDISYYNHNYYIVPFEIDDCDIVYQEYQECSNETICSIGKLVDGIFEPKYYFCPVRDFGYGDEVILDLSDISTEMKWT